MLADFLTSGGSFDAIAFLRAFLTSMPVFILALSFHEAAHAFVADRCGDPTARLMGRLTLNPLKHVDPMGLLMLLLVGIGYAKPVPVNPNNFKNPRRDDLKVSLAGITANLILCLLSLIALYIFLGVFLARGAAMSIPEGALLGLSGGELGLYEAKSIFQYAPYVSEMVASSYMGNVGVIVYEMIAQFAQINLVLAVFNLLPLPPLDGYHVFNDLILKGRLFASQRAANIGRGVLLLLLISGLLSQGLGFVVNKVLNGAGTLAYSLLKIIQGI